MAARGDAEAGPAVSARPSKANAAGKIIRSIIEPPPGPRSCLDRSAALEDPLQLDAMSDRVDDGGLEQVLDAHELAPAGAVNLLLELLIGDLGQVPPVGAQHVVSELRAAGHDLERILARVDVVHRSAHPFTDPGQIAACRHEHMPGEVLSALVARVTVGFGHRKVA